MDAQIRGKAEGGRPIGAVHVVGALEQAEPGKPAALGVGEKGEARAESGAECGQNFGRVDAEHDDPRVGDLELVLHGTQPAHKALLLGAPPTARGDQDERIAPGEFGERPGPARVVGQVEVGELLAGLQHQRPTVTGSLSHRPG